MENKSKIIAQTKSQTPAYLKELEKLIQNYTNYITNKFFTENDINSSNSKDKLFKFKKLCIYALSYMNENNLKSAIDELEKNTQNQLNQIQELSNLFSKPEEIISESIIDESFIQLITSTNKSIEEKFNILLEKTNFFENLDLKSIKKLQGIYQDNTNNKALSNFLLQLSPLQRELNYIMENLENKKQKLAEKENTYKLNSSKAEAYTKELETTSEKFKNALAIQENYEREILQLSTEKNVLEKELRYLQENLIEKITKKGKKIKIFRLRNENEKDEKIRKIIKNNILLQEEIEKKTMSFCDANKLSKCLQQKIKDDYFELDNIKKYAYKLLSLKFKQIAIENSKIKLEKLEDDYKKLEILQNQIDKLIEYFKQFDISQEEFKKTESKYLFNKKKYNKYRIIHEKLASQLS